MWKVPAKGHYLLEWRKHRGLSLERLAQRLESEPGGEPIISRSSLNRIERGEQDYTQEVLQALAIALDCEPTDLLIVNPLVDGVVIDLLSVLRSLPEEKIEMATRMLKAIA
jgi:transcriptional regulator with XRE-family HTH domain